jgi:hypothetical protein
MCRNPCSSHGALTAAVGRPNRSGDGYFFAVPEHLRDHMGGSRLRLSTIRRDRHGGGRCWRGRDRASTHRGHACWIDNKRRQRIELRLCEQMGTRPSRNSTGTAKGGGGPLSVPDAARRPATARLRLNVNFLLRRILKIAAMHAGSESLRFSPCLLLSRKPSQSPPLSQSAFAPGASITSGRVQPYFSLLLPTRSG